MSTIHARMAFDAEMANPNNQEAQRRSPENKARAQQKAATYPNTWEGFEKHLEDLLNDIKDAEYSTEYIILKGFKLGIPSSSNSYSAQLFIFSGGFLGLVIMLFFFGFFSPGLLFVTVATGFVAAGAWGGYFLHTLIKNEVKGK